MLSDLLQRLASIIPDDEALDQRLTEIEESLRRLRATRPPRRSTDTRQIAAVGPPDKASYLLYLLLVKADRQTIPGDLEEEFALIILPKFGARRARIWFWSQTIKAIAFRNPLCRWLLVGSIVKVGEYFRNKIGG
jgi:hypothetical protein